MIKKQGMAERNNIKPNIEDISKNNPFKVPDHYFDNFAIRMADKIGQIEAAKEPKSSFAWMRPQYAVIALTSVVILFSLGIYSLNHTSHKNLSINELSQNIEYSIVSEMDENELIGQLEVAEKNSTLPADTLNKTHQEYSKKVIEYLSKEDIDFNTIVDAL